MMMMMIIKNREQRRCERERKKKHQKPKNQNKPHTISSYYYSIYLDLFQLIHILSTLKIHIDIHY